MREWSNEKSVYEPDRFITMGFIVSWHEMALTVFRSRELIWRLFLRDFHAKYRQSFLGIVWAVLNPILTVGSFVFLNRSGILNIGATPIPYPLFALAGITVYGIFSTGLSACSNSIVGAGGMVVKINFPKITLVLAAMGQALVEFLVRLALIAIVILAYGVPVPWTAILGVPALFPVVLLTLGIGLPLSLLSAVFRDVIHVVSFLTTLLLFLVPVLYPAPETGTFALVNAWNPLSHLITGSRDFLITGGLSDPMHFFGATVFSVLIFLLSWRVFFMSEPRIAERV